METFLGEGTLPKWFYLSPEKGSFPLGANCFLLEKTPFRKGTIMQKSKQKVIKVDNDDNDDLVFTSLSTLFK